MIKINNFSDINKAMGNLALTPLCDEASKTLIALHHQLGSCLTLDSFDLSDNPIYNRSIVILENNAEWDEFNPETLMAESKFFYGDKQILIETHRGEGTTTVIGFARKEKVLTAAVDNRFAEHKCLYIGWDEFDDVLGEIYGEGSVSFRDDEDFYKVLTVDGENLSDGDVVKKIAEHLGISLSSSHADENGVWFVISEPIMLELPDKPVGIAVIQGGNLTEFHTNIPSMRFDFLDYDNIEMNKGADDDEDERVAELEEMIKSGTLKNIG